MFQAMIDGVVTILGYFLGYRATDKVKRRAKGRGNRKAQSARGNRRNAMARAQQLADGRTANSASSPFL